MSAMDGLFPLPLFPEGALTHSVVTTVWIGVFVVAFFNLRLGWPLSGIVIPGYLVPLMIAKPWAALVVIIEGILTYLFIRFISTVMSRWGKWNNFFGRDRFFALILGSLVVRIVLDGYILPEIGALMNQTMGINFDYTSHLRSFGLIITALIANYMWKPGLKRGMGNLTVVVTVTFLLIRFVLMELTNFNIGRVEYMFEDLVSSFLASPKAYIIIIVTSFLASRMNVKYGWEYSGIMIPSLLALQWYQPVKLAATLVEAAVILGFASLIMKLPSFKNITIEGSRKLLLFFNISFAYKFVVGHVLLQTAPHLQVSDYYGFGYLLSTLIAMKMHQRSFLPQMTRSLFQTSLVAVVLASLIGFSLMFMSQFVVPSAPPTVGEAVEPKQIPGGLVSTLRHEKLALYYNRTPEAVLLPTPPEIDTFSNALKYIVSYVSTGEKKELEYAGSLLASVNYRMDMVSGRFLLLRENPPFRGGGFYVFDLKKERAATAEKRVLQSLTVEIPAPLDEWLVLEAGTWLFLQLDARALGVGGTSYKTSWDKSTDVLVNPQTFFHAFHRVVGRNNVMQVRTHTGESRRLLEGVRPRPGQFRAKLVRSGLWVKHAFPPGLSLAGLNRLAGDFDIKWETPPTKNMQRRQSTAGFAELFLTRRAARRTMTRALIAARDIETEKGVERIDGYLQSWLLGTKGEIADKGTNKYKPMTLEELMFFDQEVLTPLMEIIREHYRDGRFTAEGSAELRAVDAAAALLNYRFHLYRHIHSDRDYLILSENAAAPGRGYRGTYVFRLDKREPFLVQIPRPVFEKNSFEYGVYLFERLKASALLIAGTHPHANLGHNSDMVHINSKISLYNLVNQVLIREARDEPLMVVACRAFGVKPDRPVPRSDAFLALGDWTGETKLLSRFGKQLLSTLDADGVSVRLVDGSPETMGYEVGMMVQYQYLGHAINKEFSVLWLSPGLRRHFRQESDNRLENTRFVSLGIETVQADLFAYITRSKRASGMPPELMDLTGQYLNRKDAVVLSHLTGEAKRQGFAFQRVIDLNSRDSFLGIFNRANRLVAVANLSPRLSNRLNITAAQPGRNIVQRFINTRSAWLIMTDGKE